MSTAGDILAAALRAFNERGSHAVTTNDLAREVGISVGNLYYHFRNKEEIIRAVFERLNEAWRTRLIVPDPARPTWADIEMLVGEHFAVLWEFRFFFREQAALRQRDRLLARRWVAAHKRGRAGMAQLLRGLCAGLNPSAELSDAAIAHTTDVCWLLADYWLPFMESRGQAMRKTDLEMGVVFFRRAVTPLVERMASEEVGGGSPAVVQRSC